MKTMQYVAGNPVRKNGRLVYIEEKDCVRQRLVNALKLWKGEWFLNTTASVDWHTLLQDKPASDRRIKAAVQDVLLDDSEVSSVESINIEYDRQARKASIAFSVKTLYGTVEATA